MGRSTTQVTPLTVQPTEELQRNVRGIIAILDDGELSEAEIFWEESQALILVGGEKHVRKQQLIVVYANGLRPSSAIVKGWADGIRDTRIG